MESRLPSTLSLPPTAQNPTDSPARLEPAHQSAELDEVTFIAALPSPRNGETGPQSAFSELPPQADGATGDDDDDDGNDGSDFEEQDAGENATNGQNTDSAPNAERVIKKRAAYTREQKLSAITFATTTYVSDPSGVSRLISGAEAAKHLNIPWSVLGQWIKDVAKIEAMPPGSQKHRVKGTQYAGITKPRKRKSSVFLPYTPRGPHTESQGYQVQPLTSFISSSVPQPPPPPTPQSASGSGQHHHLPVTQPPPAHHVSRGSAPSVQTAPPIQPAPPPGLVAYETSFFSAGRQDQVICSNIDENSKSDHSDVRFSILVSSQADYSTVHNSQLSSSHVHSWSEVHQSTLKSAAVGNGAELRACSVENSFINQARLKNCTVRNSQIAGGSHEGKTFINGHVTGNERLEPPSAPTDEDSDYQDAEGGEGTSRGVT